MTDTSSKSPATTNPAAAASADAGAPSSADRYQRETQEWEQRQIAKKKNTRAFFWPGIRERIWLLVGNAAHLNHLWNELAKARSGLDSMRGDARRFHRRRYYFRWREFVAALNSRRKALSKEKAFVATLDVEHLRQDLGCEGVPPNAMAREYLASHKGYQPQGVESNADIARITQIARPAHSGFTLAAWRREIEAELEAGTGGAARPSSKALTKLAAYVAETEATTERYRFLQQYAQTL